MSNVIFYLTNYKKKKREAGEGATVYCSFNTNDDKLFKDVPQPEKYLYMMKYMLYCV